MPFDISSGEKLYKTICNFYDKKGVSYQRDDEQCLTLVVNKERDVPVNLFVAAEANPPTLIICGRLPFKISEESQEMMLMALQALNQRLTVGHFRMYLPDGTVDYRVNLPLVGIQCDDEWLENVLSEAYSTVTHRDEKILSLLRGEITFEEFDKYVR